MAGETFLGQDYLNAASSFGSSLGSGVLSTLGGAASAATNVAGGVLGTAYNYGSGTGGYLSSLTQQPSYTPTTTNRSNQFSAPDLGSFGQSFNMNALTSGFSSMKSPDIIGTIGGTFGGLVNTGGSLINTGSQSFNALLSPQQSSPLQSQSLSSAQKMQDQFNDMVTAPSRQSPIDNLSSLVTAGAGASIGATSKAQQYGGDILSGISNIWNAPVIPKASAAGTGDTTISLYGGGDISKAYPGSTGIASSQKPSSSLGSSFDAAAKTVNDIFGFGKSKDESKTSSPTFQLSSIDKPRPQSYKKIEGGGDYTSKQVSDVPVINGVPVNQPKDSNGNVISITFGESLAKPDEAWLKANDKRWFDNIGDQPTRDLVGKEVVDTWSDPSGAETKYRINSLEEALEFKKQQSLRGLNDDIKGKGISGVAAADFYQNELDKAAQNRVTLSSSFHHITKDADVSVKYNPWENAGDVALGFLKGGGRDILSKTYAWNTDVAGKLGVVNLLPGGIGLNESRWAAALASDAAGKKAAMEADFRPAISKMLAADASTGVYGTVLSGRGSESDIIKLPKSFQDALGKIAKGETQKQMVSQTVYDASGKPATFIDDKGFTRPDYKSVEVTRAGSIDIPKWFTIVPESRKGIVEFTGEADINKGSVVTDKNLQKELENAQEVDIYIPLGKDNSTKITGKVLVNEDTGEQTYYQRHIDPSTGKYTSLYHVVGGGGEGSAQSGEFQFGSPLKPTVYSQEGKLLDTSGFTFPVQMKYTPTQRAEINKAIETIYSINDKRDTSFEANQRTASAFKELRGMGLDNTQIDDMINARKTTETPDMRYSALNLANFVSPNVKNPITSAPWTFPSGDKREQGLTKEDRATLPVLITSNTGNVKRFSDIFAKPAVSIPLSIESKLLNKPIDEQRKIVGGDIVFKPGYTGTDRTPQQMVQEMIITPGTQPGTSKNQQIKISTALEQLKQTSPDSSAYNIYKKQLTDMGIKNDYITRSVNDLKFGRATSDDLAKGLVYSSTSLPAVPTMISQVQSPASESSPFMIPISDTGSSRKLSQISGSQTSPNEPDGFIKLVSDAWNAPVISPVSAAGTSDTQIRYASGAPVTSEISTTKPDLIETARSAFATTPLGAYLVGTPEEKTKGEQTRQKVDQYTNVLGVGMIGGPSTASKATAAISGADLFSSAASPVTGRIALTTKGAAPALSEVRIPGISDLVFKSKTQLGAIPLRPDKLYDVGTGAMVAKAATTGTDEIKDSTLQPDLMGSARSLFVSTPLGATLIGTQEEKDKADLTRQKVDQYTNVLGIGMIGGPSAAGKSASVFSTTAAPTIERIALTTKGAAPALSEVRVPGISDLVFKSKTQLGAIPLRPERLYDVGTGAMAAKAATSEKTPDKLTEMFAGVGRFVTGIPLKSEKSYAEPTYDAQSNREFSGELKSKDELKPLTTLDIIGGGVKASPLGLVTALFSPTYSATKSLMGEDKNKEQVIANYDTSRKELMDNLISAQKSGVVIIDKKGNAYSGLSNDDKTFSALLDRGVSDMKYDQSNKAHIDVLTKYMDSEKKLTESAGKVNEIQKNEDSNNEFMRSITGETAQDYIATKYTKPYMPSYETFGTNFLNMSADPFVKNLSAAEKAVGINPLYERTDVTNLLPSEHFLAYNRPEGFTKTVYESDQPGAKGTRITYGGKTGGLYDTAQFAQATTQGVFNYPREKPLETVSFLTLPTGFGITEDVLTGAALKLAPKSGTLIKAGTQVTKGGLLGLMGGSDIAHVAGRDLISDRGILAPSIVGKDDKGDPIYAGQSAREWGTRTGEKLPNWMIMMGPGAKVQQTLYQPKYTPELGKYETVFDRFGKSVKTKMTPAEEKIAQTIDVAPDMLKTLKKSGISESLKIGKEGTSGENIQAIKTLIGVDVLPNKMFGPPTGTKVAQPNIAYLSEVKGLSERAYTHAANKLTGTGDELFIKGSTAGQTTIGNIKDGKVIGYGDQSIKINDVGSVVDGKVIVRPAKDIDVSTQSPKAFVRAYKEGTQRALESDGWTDVKVVQKGNLYGADRYYEISGKTPDGVPQKFTTQDGADLKFIGSDVVRPTGGKAFNVERMLYETEPEVPFRLSTLLLGETGTRGKSKVESLSTTKEKVVNPYINKGVEKSDISRMYVDDVSVTFLDKINFMDRFMKTARKGGPEVEKVDKTAWDIVNTHNEMTNRFEINKASGKFSDAEIAIGQKALNTNKVAIDKLLDGTYDVRYTPNGPLQKIKLRDAVENYNTKVQSGIDYYRNPQAINTNVKDIDVYHRGSITDTSAAAVTNAGIANLKTKDIDRMQLVGGRTSFVTPKGYVDVSKKDVSKVEKATTAKGVGKSTSASSTIGMMAPLSLIDKDRESPLSGRSLSALISPMSSKVSSGGSREKTPSSESSKERSSGDSSSGSSSYMSSYSPSSSSSSSGSSGSSSQSSSSMSPRGTGGGFMGGFPFLAPGGGGGGSGGSGGHANAIIKNPLTALSVAGSGKQFMKFGDLNKFVKSVKGNTGNLNPNVATGMVEPAGAGLPSAKSSGNFASSLEEATSMNIRNATARKSKKQKVKADRKVSMPKITTPHINLNANVKGDLSIKSKKKSKKGRYK